MNIVERALDYVKDGDVVGLGTGRAAGAFVRALGARVATGLRIRGIPTSQATQELASDLGIPLTTLDAVPTLDVAVDGADEVDPHLNLIKGYGGALVREKIVAAAAEKFVVLVGAEKLVATLGARRLLPVEVVPFAVAPCCRRLRDLGCNPTPRQTQAGPFTSDNGNVIIDCEIDHIAQPTDFERRLIAIPGVVETGLFVGMADVVLVQDDDAVHILTRPSAVDTSSKNR